MILGGDYDRAAAVCVEGISLARGYGGGIDAARFELVLGRARQCSSEPEAAIPSLLRAAEAFRDARLILDEITTRSILAVSCRSVGDELAAISQSEQVSQLLARSGIADAAHQASELQRACERSVGAALSRRGGSLMAD